MLIEGAASWNRSEGTVDFAGLAGATALPTTLVGIPNYGNNERLALNVKGTYALKANLGLIAGLAYEDVSFDDIQFDPYSYILPATPLTVPTQGTASYLSGWYRDPGVQGDHRVRHGHLQVLASPAFRLPGRARARPVPFCGLKVRAPRPFGWPEDERSVAIVGAGRST